MCVRTVSDRDACQISVHLPRGAVGLHVLREHLDDALGGVVVAPEREAKVDQVASLLALVARAGLRGEHLVEVSGAQVGSAGEPARRRLEAMLGEPADGEVLARVDLDLQLQPDWRNVLLAVRGGRGAEHVGRGAASEREGLGNRLSRERLEERARDDGTVLDVSSENPRRAVEIRCPDEGHRGRR